MIVSAGGSSARVRKDYAAVAVLDAGKVLNFLVRLWRPIGFQSNHLAVKFVNRIITFRHLAPRSYATHSL
jgi:hypothetical protein